MEAKKPQEPAAPPQSKQDEVKPPRPPTQPRDLEGKKRDEAPADSSPRGDPKRLTPEAAERMAEAKKQERSPTRPPSPDDEAKKAKPGVQQPDEPASVGKAKTPAADPKHKPRTEQNADEERDPRRATPDDKKKPEPASEHPTAATGSQLALRGLKLSVPGGWVKEEVPSSATTSVAVLRIPKTDPGSAEGTIRITHDPSMKGKDMVDRLLGQVAKPDGSPVTRADAKIGTTQVGTIRVTTVDLTGTVKANTRDPGKPGQRMIAAILDHPQGPHVIVAVGPAPSMQKWASAIDSFIRSATAD